MPHLFVHVLLMLQKFRIFFRMFAQAPRLFFFGYSDTPWTCITFGIFISDISDIQHLIYLCMLWKFRIFLGHLPEHQSCFFLDILDTPRTSVTFKIFMSGISNIQYLIYLCTFCWCSGSSAFFSGHLPDHHSCFSLNIPDTPRTCITSDMFISDISDIPQLIYLCTFSWCSGSSASFSGHLPEHWGCFFPDIPDTPRTCITFDIFILDISDIKHLIYSCMLQKFRIFLGHLPEHQGCFFSDIPDTPRTCITFDIFISDILDIKHLIYLCMLQKFRIFLEHLPKHQGCFSFGYSGHSQDMCYIWHVYFTYSGHSAANIFVHILLMLRKFHILFRTFSQAPRLFSFGCSGHSQNMYYIWHIYFRYFRGVLLIIHRSFHVLILDNGAFTLFSSCP